jgi:diketogulonate reductase-like aldo/keto reductase
MERRHFGPVRREVAVAGQGTWYIESAQRASAIAALRRGLDLGMGHIDTAEMSGRGRREDRRRRDRGRAKRSSYSSAAAERVAPRRGGARERLWRA